jgi:hypothetical protein
MPAQGSQAAMPATHCAEDLPGICQTDRNGGDSAVCDFSPGACPDTGVVAAVAKAGATGASAEGCQEQGEASGSGGCADGGGGPMNGDFTMGLHGAEAASARTDQAHWPAHGTGSAAAEGLEATGTGEPETGAGAADPSEEAGQVERPRLTAMAAAEGVSQGAAQARSGSTSPDRASPRQPDMTTLGGPLAEPVLNNTRKRSRPTSDAATNVGDSSAGRTRRCPSSRCPRADVVACPRRRTMTAKSAAEMLIALRRDDGEPDSAICRRGGRGRPSPPPLPLSKQEAAATHSSIALQRDTLYTAFRKHAVRDDGSIPPTEASTITNHVLRIVCVTKVHEACLRIDARDVVTHIVIAMSRGGPVLELPTFSLARGVREGVMLAALLICFIPAGALSLPLRCVSLRCTKAGMAFEIAVKFGSHGKHVM